MSDFRFIESSQRPMSAKNTLGLLDRIAYSTGFIKTKRGANLFWLSFIFGMTLLSIYLWIGHNDSAQIYGNGTEIESRYPNLYPERDYPPVN